MKKRAIVTLTALALALAAPAAWAGQAMPAIEPPALTIGTFYAGQEATLTGEIAAGQEVLLEVVGPAEDAVFDVKGRVGPFWMNRGQVRIDRAPSLYILLLPAKPPAETALKALEVGMAHLEAEAQVEAPGRQPDQVFDLFLGFKQKGGLYQQQAGAVNYAPAGQGRKQYTARFSFPSFLASGQYQVRATVLENGAKAARYQLAYPVSDGAFLAWLKYMAFGHSLAYGVLSVIIALVAGGLMGVMFKGGKGGH